MPVKFNSAFHGMLPDAVTQFKNIEAELLKSDRQFLDLKESKNNLEAICYKYQERLNGNLAPYMEDGARNAVLKLMKETVDWLYGDGENSTTEEYLKRYKALFEVCDPCSKRSIFYTEVDFYFKQFAEIQDHCNKQLASEELAHLTEEQVKQVTMKVQQVADFMGNL